MIARFTISGAPRTKGNHPVVARNSRRVLVLPSRPYRQWLNLALAQAPRALSACRSTGFALPIAARVDVTARFYRDRAVGDEDNFKKGLGDYLQRAGVVSNDKLIHWTGETRLLKDAANPRIEIEIAPAAASAAQVSP